MARTRSRGKQEEERADEARVRAAWSGTLSFGLVNVPVALFPGTRAAHAALRMVAPDGTPLERRWHCPAEDVDVPWSELVRGFETDAGEYVVMSDEEIEAAAPEKTRDIDVRRFVPRGALDPAFFDRGYFLIPDGDSTKAYRLLAWAMEDGELAGIATFVMRTREYLIAILAEEGVLRAETLRWAGEVRSPADVGLAKPGRPDAAAVRRIEKTISAHDRRALSEKELRDPTAARLEKRVAAKLRKDEDVVAAPADAEPPSPRRDIVDLMEVLKRSLEG